MAAQRIDDSIVDLTLADDGGGASCRAAASRSEDRAADSALSEPAVLKLSEARVERMPIGRLREAGRRVRKRDKRRIEQLAAAMRTYGYFNPIVVDARGRVYVGLLRLLAAKALGLTHVPVIELAHLSEAELRALALADNKIAEGGEWDEHALRVEIGELLNLGQDLTIAGFETGELDALMIHEVAVDDDPVDAQLERPRAPITRLGDIWTLGRHRLACADVRDSAALAALMRAERARAVWTDPPYNLAARHISMSAKPRHGDFKMAAGEMSSTEFTEFLRQSLQHLAAYAREGSLHYVCMDWRHLREVMQAGDAVFDELKAFCVWDKVHAGMGSFYRSQHELVLVYKKGKAKHVNNIELGRHGRSRSNLWVHAGLAGFGPGRAEALALHATVKPVDLVAEALMDCTHRGDIVLDGFAGSGTILLAAERTGRRARAIEIDPGYVDVAIERWRRLTGGDAIRESDGASFTELRAACAGAGADAEADHHG